MRRVTVGARDYWMGRDGVGFRHQGYGTCRALPANELHHVCAAAARGVYPLQVYLLLSDWSPLPDDGRMPVQDVFDHVVVS